MKTKLSTRIVSMILMVAMLLGCTGVLLPVAAADGESGSFDTAELVGNNYAFLNAYEKAILSSGALRGDRYEMTVPDDSDLVKIDKAAKTVTAASVKDTDGTWVPVRATVYYENEAGEEVSAIFSLQNGTGSFSCPAERYHIDVKYDLQITVDSDVQKALLDAPYALVAATINLNRIYAERGNMRAVAENIDSLYKLTTGEMRKDYPSGASIVIDLEEGAARDAIISLKNETSTNNGHFLLYSLITSYNGAQNKILWAANNAQQMQQQNTALLTRFRAISEAESSVRKLSASARQFGFASEADRIDEALDYLSDVAESLAMVDDGAWETSSYLNAAATDAQFGALNAAIANGISGRFTARVQKHGDATIQNPLTAATTNITKGVEQYRVNVTVKANVVPSDARDDAALTALTGEKTLSLVFDKGTSRAHVLEAIAKNGLEAEVLSAWSAYGVCEENYTRTVAGLDETLQSDSDCVISYMPKEYSLTLNYEAKTELTVPYGYAVTLKEHADTEKSYDYTVNGKLYHQGDVYTVTGDTLITRREGKAVAKYNMATVIAASLTPGAQLSEQEKAVLTAGGLKDSSVWYRVPDQAAALVNISALEEAGSYRIMAAEYDSGLLSGAKWTAANAQIIDATGAVIDTVTLENGIGTFTCEEFDHVKVNYTLTVSEEDIPAATVEEFLNLPNILAHELVAQKAALASLTAADVVRGLSEVYGSRLDMINALAKDYSEEAKEAIRVMMDRCVDESSATNSLYLYEYVLEYQSKGLAWYYADDNAVKMAEQVWLLRDSLNTVWEDEAFQYDLANDPDLSKYKGKLEKIKNDLQDVALVSVNPAIEATSDYLGALVTALEAAQENTAEHLFDGALTLGAAVTGEAPDTAAVHITVRVVDKAGNELYVQSGSRSFTSGAVLDEAAEQKLAALTAGLEGGYAIDKVHFARKAEGTLPVRGDALNETVSVVYTWSPIAYTFRIEGSDDQLLYADGSALTLTLPACEEAGYLYEYTVGQTQTRAASYTFGSVAELDALVGVGGEYTVARKTINQNREKTLTLIDQLNAAIAENGLLFQKDGEQALLAAFIPMEDASGNLSVVLRVSPRRTDAEYKAVLTAVANVLVDSTVKYIGLDNRVLWNSELHLQAVIDMLLNSGLSLDTLTGIIDENGEIAEMTELSDLRVIGADQNGAIPVFGAFIPSTELLGGKLLATNLQLGNAQADALNVPLYVTLEDFDLSASSLKKARENVVKVQKYLDVTLSEGTARLSLRVPEALYPYFIAAMLVTDHTSIEKINSMDLREVLSYGKNLAEPVITDGDFSTDTVERTLEKLGETVDLASLKNAAELVRKALSNLLQNTTETGSAHGNQYTGTLRYDLRQLLSEKLKLSDTLLKLVAEANTAAGAEEPAGLSAKVELTLKNMETDYVAMIADARADGLRAKYRFVTDLDAALKTLHKDAVVVLLADAELSETAVLKDAAVIDLNGYTLKGNLKSDCTGTYGVSILDSRVGTYQCGTLEGTLSGRFTLTGGRFTTDVTEQLKKGYDQDENGYVVNRLYALYEEENGDVTVALTPDLLEKQRADVPQFKVFLADLGVDILAKMYTGAQLSIDDHMLYSMYIEDLLSYVRRPYRAALEDLVSDAVECVDTEGLSALINELIADLSDFNGIADAIENGRVLLSYTVKQNAWSIAPYLTGEKDQNRITADIVPAEKEMSFRLNVRIDERATEEQKNELVTLARELGRTVDITGTDVKINDISYADKKISVKYDASGIGRVDLSGNGNYPALMAVMVAYGAGDAQKTELCEAVRSYMETGSTLLLKAALEKVTVSQFVGAVKATRRADINTMLASLGIDAPQIASLAEIYYKLLRVCGGVMNRLEINGSGRTLGSFATGEYGTYHADTTVKGVALDATLRLFTDKKLVTVTDASGAVLYDGDSLDEALKNRADGDVITVNSPVDLDEDATVTAKISIVGTELITWNSHGLILAAAEAQITADSDIEAAVLSGLDTHTVEKTATEDAFVYTLKEIPQPEKKIVVTDRTGMVLYEGDSLAEALRGRRDGDTVTVREAVAMTENAEISAKITLVGAEKIALGSYGFVLTDANAVIEADAELGDKVLSGLDTHTVAVVHQGSKVVYSLTEKPVELKKIIVTDANGETVYEGDSLAEALRGRRDGDTVTVREAVAMTENAELGAAIEIVGAEKITLGDYGFVLTDKDASLTADKDLGEKVVSGVITHNVTMTERDGKHVYTLTEKPVELKKILVTDVSGATVYEGDLLSEAFRGRRDGDTVTVREAVAMTENAEINAAIEIVGAEKITLGDYGFVLTDKDASLTADKDLGEKVSSGLDTHNVTMTERDGKYVYTLTEKPVELKKILVTDANGATVYEGDSLAEALRGRRDGDTITVREAVTMTENIQITASLTLSGAAKIDFGANKLLLAAQNARLVSDASLAGKIDSALAAYGLGAEERDGRFIYSLASRIIVVLHPDGTADVYSSSKLAQVLQQAEAGDEIYVYGPATLSAPVAVNADITIRAAGNITFDGGRILLGTGVTLKADASLLGALAAQSGRVIETPRGNMFLYNTILDDVTISAPTAAVTENGLVRGAKIDTENKLIYLDVAPSGITAEQFRALVTFSAENASRTEMQLAGEDGTVSESALVATGTKVTMTAANAYSSAEAVYTVIILGDTNCNGRIESGDGTRINLHFIGTRLLDGYALLAADTNQNGRVESGDAVNIAAKYAYKWDDSTYTSALK